MGGTNEDIYAKFASDPSRKHVTVGAGAGGGPSHYLPPPPTYYIQPTRPA